MASIIALSIKRCMEEVAESHVVSGSSGHGYVDDEAIPEPLALESILVIAKEGVASGMVIAHSDGHETGMADSAIYKEHALDPCLDIKMISSSTVVSTGTSTASGPSMTAVGGGLSNSWWWSWLCRRRLD